MSFLDKNHRNECSVISDLAIHKLFTIYLCEAVSSKSVIIKLKKRSFKNVLLPALSCINLHTYDLCKNLVYPSH